MKDSKNLVESILDTQKNAVDNFLNSTKKIYGSNPGTEMMEKGTEMYKEWVEKQKNAVEQFNTKANDIKSNIENQTEKSKDFYTNWYNNQLESTKKLWETNQNFFKQMNGQSQNTGFNFFNSNPMNMMSDAMKNYNQFINELSNMNKWSNLFTQFNPMNMAQQFQQNLNNTPNLFNSYFEAINQTTKEFQNTFSNFDKQDLFGQFAGNATNFGKFVEIWSPYWESIKKGTFNVDLFKQTFNAQQLKDFTDKMFQLMPDTYQSYFNQNNEFMKQFFGQNMDAAQSWYSQIKGNLNQLQSAYNPFQGMMNQYNQWSQFFNQAATPFNKMATPNSYTKSMTAWSAIMDKLTIYSVKNTELQYMMYLQSQKVMEAVAQNIQDKIANNTEITDFTQLYQEWLNVSDKVYVELFESEEYSQLMAEVSSLQLKIKKAVDTQIEESLSMYPVATKSELDELYKVIYELKKEVRQLEKMLELENNETKTSQDPTTNSKQAKTGKTVK